MWFWWFMLVCNLFLPLTMIIAGWMMWKHSPKKINMVVGYRTARSIKNEETWKFAHDYCGKLWWKFGWGFAAVTILIQLPFYQGSENAISILSLVVCAVQLASIFLTIILTEKALKKNFCEDGTHR